MAVSRAHVSPRAATPERIRRSSARVTATWSTRRSSASGRGLGLRLELGVVQRVGVLLPQPHEPQPDPRAVDEEVREPGLVLAPEVGHDDRPELQALRGVDGHEPHRAGAAELHGRLTLAGLRLDLGARVVDEPAQVASPRLLERPREADELVDVRQPPPAARQPQDVQVVPRGEDGPLEDLVEPAPGRPGALGRHERQEPPQRRGVARAQPAGEGRLGEDVPRPAAGRPRQGGHVGQAVRGEPAQRRGQRAVQRQVVVRVGQDGEIGREVLHGLAQPVAAARRRPAWRSPPAPARARRRAGRWPRG